jgi:hypothetical protein
MFVPAASGIAPLTAIAATAAQRRGWVETRQSLSGSAATEGKKTRSVSTCAANLEPDLPSDSYVARARKRSLKAQEVPRN